MRSCGKRCKRCFNEFWHVATYHECTANQRLQYYRLWGGRIGGRIAIGPTQDLPFVRGDTPIIRPITIDGGGPTSEHHLFRLAGSADFKLIGVTIQNSHTGGAGAAIFSINGGKVSLINSSVQQLDRRDGGN